MRAQRLSLGVVRRNIGKLIYNKHAVNGIGQQDREDADDTMTDIRPYTISIPDAQISDLKQRLSAAKFPDELDEAAWDLGAPLADVKRLCSYWKETFDWRRVETELNKLPQFITDITVDGYAPLKIHFLHQKAKSANALPLLFVHGWPGSYVEVTKVLDKLTSGNGQSAPAFDVVALSLPNFGWSEGPSKRGFALEHYAECCNRLMLKLGYNEYVTQGGDWGYYITRAISLLYPQNCKATHLNMNRAQPPTFATHPLLAIEHAVKPYSKRERQGLERTKWFTEEGAGYRWTQSTKPQTLGYGLADSPVMLMAWIYEKLHDWTDAYPWTDDEICEWISIYWFSTAGPAASVRIYYEVVKGTNVTRTRTGQWIDGVKLGFSYNPMELSAVPNTWTRTQGQVVFERYHDSGGHFFAWEKPDNLVGDVREMFGKKGGAYGVVKGKTGYAS